MDKIMISEPDCSRMQAQMYCVDYPHLIVGRYTDLNGKKQLQHLLAIFLWVVICLLPGSIFANGSLLKSDVQVRGADASVNIPLWASDSQSKALRLNILWSYSSFVKPELSTVHLLIDGKIRSSRKLSELHQQGWDIKLQGLPVGRHELTLQFQLRSKEDDCQLDAQALWVTVRQTSTVHGANVLAPNSEAKALAVRDYPLIWKNNGLTPTVMISHDFSWNAELTGAYLQAHLLFNRYALAVADVSDFDARKMIDAANSSNSPQLRLKSYSRLPITHPVVDRWTRVPSTQFAFFAASPNELEIVVKDAQYLQRALRFLGEDQSRLLCHEALCSYSVPENSLSFQAKEMNKTKDESSLWQMQTGDYPSGWNAKGAGTHKLRQVWLRPMTMQMQSDVELYVEARTSLSRQIDLSHSSLSVRINDQLLATYSLIDWDANHSRIRIPANLWQARVWVIDFEVRIVARDAIKCMVLTHEDFWITIDPQTRLNAKTKSIDGVGISSYWQRSLDRSTQSIVWESEQNALPTASQIKQFAPLFISLNQQRHPENFLEWVFVKPATCTASTCIFLKSMSPSPDGTLPLKNISSALANETYKLPDISDRASAILVWIKASGTSPEHLRLIVGDSSKTLQTLPELNLAAMYGSFGVLTDQWHNIAVAEWSSQVGMDEKNTKGNTSQQQSRLRWINLIWALLSIAICTALAMIFWRKKKKPDPHSWEVK